MGHPDKNKCTKVTPWHHMWIEHLRLIKWLVLSTILTTGWARSTIVCRAVTGNNPSQIFGNTAGVVKILSNLSSACSWGLFVRGNLTLLGLGRNRWWRSAESSSWFCGGGVTRVGVGGSCRCWCVMIHISLLIQLLQLWHLPQALQLVVLQGKTHVMSFYFKLYNFFTNMNSIFVRNG